MSREAQSGSNIKTSLLFTMKIAFFQEHLSERGTTIALYNYAIQNERVLGNSSIIIYVLGHPMTAKCTESFIRKQTDIPVVPVQSFGEVDNVLVDHGVDAIYIIKYGYKNHLLSKVCTNLIHAIFVVDPHGEKYACVSQEKSKLSNVDWLPHMVDVLSTDDDCLRATLNISMDATVLGCYGGKQSFNIPYVRECVSRSVRHSDNLWFIFMNMEQWDVHPRIVHLGPSWDRNQKARFIKSCTAMLHGRDAGETFGLAVAEFSIMNKPVITCKGLDNAHLDILQEKCIQYTDKESLMHIISNVKKIAQTRVDWNAYRDFTAERVMQKFASVYLGAQHSQL